MNKKGVIQLMLYVIIELVILVAVLLFLLWEVNVLAKDTSFEKRATATDTALLLDTMQSAPGTAYMLYKVKTPEPFVMTFITTDRPFVRVASKKDKQEYKQFPFGIDKYIDPSLSDIDLSQEALFSKTGIEFKASNMQDALPEALRCPTVEIKGTVNDKIIVIDPGYSAGQSQDIIKKLEHINIKGPFGKKEMIDDPAHSDTVEAQIAAAKPEAVILLNSIAKTDSKNTIKAFIPNENEATTRKLACYVLNYLLRSKDLPASNGLSIIPTSSNAILNQNKLSVLIEFDNDRETQTKLLDDADYIGEAISAALTKYYENG
ncbi:MAG: hypothetical protein Q7J54_01460 [Candidatus Woesearchaeota archaeon]|nr:hypothetical protein [Candidatus Woesearchaeota archaeon]